MLLLDGYDEYRKGKNSDIDKAIEKPYGKCLLLLTTRPGKEDKDETFIKKEVRDKMDGIVKMLGFTWENIVQCSKLYMRNSEKCEAMLEQIGKHRQLRELMSTPINLLMICVLFIKNRTLPESLTYIYELIYQLSMDRTTMKNEKFKCKAACITNIGELRDKLGRKALDSLQDDDLLLKKVFTGHKCILQHQL